MSNQKPDIIKETSTTQNPSSIFSKLTDKFEKKIKADALPQKVLSLDETPLSAQPSSEKIDVALLSSQEKSSSNVSSPNQNASNESTSLSHQGFAHITTELGHPEEFPISKGDHLIQAATISQNYAYAAINQHHKKNQPISSEAISLNKLNSGEVPVYPKMITPPSDTKKPLIYQTISSEPLLESTKQPSLLSQQLAQQQAQQLAEKQAREKQAQELAQKQAKALAEKQAQMLAEKRAKELAEKHAKALAEKQAQELAEKQAREKQAKELAEKHAKALAEKQAQELAEKQAKEFAEKQAREKQAQELAQKQTQELAKKQAQELAQKQAQERIEKQKHDQQETQTTQQDSLPSENESTSTPEEGNSLLNWFKPSYLANVLSDKITDTIFSENNSDDELLCLDEEYNNEPYLTKALLAVGHFVSKQINGSNKSVLPKKIIQVNSLLELSKTIDTFTPEMIANLEHMKQTLERFQVIENEYLNLSTQLPGDKTLTKVWTYTQPIEVSKLLLEDIDSQLAPIIAANRTTLEETLRKIGLFIKFTWQLINPAEVSKFIIDNALGPEYLAGPPKPTFSKRLGQLICNLSTASTLANKLAIDNPSIKPFANELNDYLTTVKEFKTTFYPLAPQESPLEAADLTLIEQESKLISHSFGEVASPPTTTPTTLQGINSLHINHFAPIALDLKTENTASLPDQAQPGEDLLTDPIVESTADDMLAQITPSTLQAISLSDVISIDEDFDHGKPVHHQATDVKQDHEEACRVLVISELQLNNVKAHLQTIQEAITEILENVNAALQSNDAFKKKDWSIFSKLNAANIAQDIIDWWNAPDQGSESAARLNKQQAQMLLTQKCNEFNHLFELNKSPIKSDFVEELQKTLEEKTANTQLMAESAQREFALSETAYQHQKQNAAWYQKVLPIPGLTIAKPALYSDNELQVKNNLEQLTKLQDAKNELALIKEITENWGKLESAYQEQTKVEKSLMTAQQIHGKAIQNEQIAKSLLEASGEESVQHNSDDAPLANLLVSSWDTWHEEAPVI